MKKNKYIYSFLVYIFAVFLISCGEPSMDDDARKAAEFTISSNEYSKDNNFQKAGKTYKKVQEIIKKYKKQDKYEEFYQLYMYYLEDYSYSLEGESIDNIGIQY